MKLITFRAQIAFLFFIFLAPLSFSATYLRYNHAGYYPNEKKRIILCSDNSLQNSAWELKKGNATVLSGTIGSTSALQSDYTAQNYNYEILFSSITDVGTYTFSIGSQNINQIVEVKNNPYDGVKFEVLKTIRARRSGSNDALVHNISHLGDASCDLWRNDGAGNDKANYIKENETTVDVLGGWYDAGDYIKFTLTNAYTTYHILRTYNLNTSANDLVKTYSTTAYNDLLDEAVFGLQYLEKMFPNENTFIIQVADETDHKQGFRLPENDNLNGERKAYAAFAKPQMAMTVAALALGAKTLKEYGSTAYSSQLEQKAIALYQTMLAKGVNSAWYQKDHEVFYKDESSNDNIKLAAVELYNLTKEAKYLTDANSYSLGTSYWSSWGDISMTANNTTIEHNSSHANPVKSSLRYFKTIADKQNNIWNMPHSSTWGTLYSYFGVANAALSLQLSTEDDTYKNMAIDVLDYTMGLNNWGKAFIVSEIVPNTIVNPYAQLYQLQPSIIAVGEIAEGPTNKTTHDENKQYFSPAHNPNGVDKTFNTNNLTFFDQKGDFVCMETIITGLADGLFLLAQAEELFTPENPTSTEDADNIIELNNAQGFIIYPNPSSEMLTINFQELEIYKCSFFDMNGNHLMSIRPHGKSIRTIDVSSWETGVYTSVVFLKDGKTKMESFEKI